MSTYAIPGVVGRVATLGSKGRVEVDEDVVRVRMGVAFRADVPREDIRSVRVVKPTLLAGIGVHWWLGAWVVNGRPGPAVELRLARPLRATVLGIPVHPRRILIAVEDPEALVDELS
jgi:hypothetical protein